MRRLLQTWDDLGRDSLTYLLGEGGSKALVYLLLVLLARYVGVAEFGSVNLFIALVGPLALVVGLGLPDALGRFYFRDLPFGRVVATALLLLGVSSASIAALLFWLQGAIERLLDVPPTLTLLAALCAPAIVLRSAWLATLRAEGRSGAFSAARLAEPLVSLGLVLGILAATGRLELGGILLAYAGGILTVAVVGLARLASRARPPSRAISRGLLAFSLPLVVHALAMTGLASFDQIILNQILGLEATGIYAFAYRIGMAMFLVSFGVAAAWSPFVLRRLAQPRATDELASPLRLLCTVQPVVGVALMAVLPPVARFVGADSYGAAAELVPIVVCGYVWMALYALATPFLVFHHRTLELAGFSATALTANIALNYLLIPRFGPPAAALTTVASYALLFALAWRRVARDFPGLPVARLTAAGLLTVPAAIGAWWLLS